MTLLSTAGTIANVSGTLFIVATPIGNLKDITLRALETLKSVDYVLCEDTRVTGKLLHGFEIKKDMVVINDFSEDHVIPRVVADLEHGKSIALVSDAGTPLISDPGFKLVREATERLVKVESIPGPTALISALTVSGLPSDKFVFLGFLPKKDGKRLELLKNTKDAVLNVKSTVIIYESPFRIAKTLGQVEQIFGDIDVVVCRELTKMHEEIVRGKISDVVLRVKTKGEFVILF